MPGHHKCNGRIVQLNVCTHTHTHTHTRAIQDTRKKMREARCCKLHHVDTVVCQLVQVQGVVGR